MNPRFRSRYRSSIPRSAPLPPAVRNADPTPAAAGFNGILGVGLFTQDCGATCASSANNGRYYRLQRNELQRDDRPPFQPGPEPRGAPPPGQQRRDRAAPERCPRRDALGRRRPHPRDRHPVEQRAAFRGDGLFGQSTTGNFTTQFGGRTYSSFIDSGSNGLFFTPPAASASQLPNCPSPNAVWFCPPSTLSLLATNTGASGAPSGVVPFNIGNLSDLVANSFFRVFVEVGGTFPGNFDWGLPFFFGRTVVVGYEGKASSLGNGPYWAY